MRRAVSLRISLRELKVYQLALTKDIRDILDERLAPPSSDPRGGEREKGIELHFSGI